MFGGVKAVETVEHRSGESGDEAGQTFVSSESAAELCQQAVQCTALGAPAHKQLI